MPYLPDVAQQVQYTKTVLCLANSRKMSGRCVAGKVVSGEGTGTWVRPVSQREHQEISEDDRRYSDGHTATVLDVVKIPMLQPVPHGYQTENHLIADEYYWERERLAGWDEVVNALDNVKGPLWLNGHSTWQGVNDQVPEAQAAAFGHSLVLVRPTALRISVGAEGGVFGPVKRRVRARFRFDGLDYRLSLTDAFFERRYLQGNDGEFPVEDGILCISLGETFQGHAYKLAAALITPDR